MIKNGDKIKVSSMPPESHKSEHLCWLLAAVLGANDGIVSTASFIVGVAAADTEHADLEREQAELIANPEFERAELAQIYIKRGLDPQLAAKVSEQFMAHDALGSPARDELGIQKFLAHAPYKQR